MRLKELFYVITGEFQRFPIGFNGLYDGLFDDPERSHFDVAGTGSLLRSI